jgi:hypothetical protein
MAQPLGYNSPRMSTRLALTFGLLAWTVVPPEADAQQPPPGTARVTEGASISGRIAEPDGIPAPDVFVLAAIRRGAEYELLEQTRTVTAWDGRYRIPGLRAGEYLVVVTPGPRADRNRLRLDAERRAPESSSILRPFFEPTFYPGVTGVDTAVTVTVLQGIDVEGIDVWLTPAQRFSISGRVIRPEGTNVDNVAIEYANLSAHRSGLWTVPEPGDIFHITGVPQGTVVLLARADSNRGPLAGVVSTSVSMDDVEDLELTLGTPGTIEGRIVYDADVPLSSSARTIALRQRLLPVSPLYPSPESAIDTDGRFRITNALGVFELDVPGLRVVRVSQHGREIPNAQIRVALNESVTGLEVLVGK